MASTWVARNRREGKGDILASNSLREGIEAGQRRLTLNTKKARKARRMTGAKVERESPLRSGAKSFSKVRRAVWAKDAILISCKLV